MGVWGTESPLVKMRGITKRFPGVLANDHVDLEVQAGQVHALLGENGAGKTTLMNVLSGLYRADEGEIYIKGRRANLQSPRDAIARGIGMVHQHFMLVEPQTVAENVILGLQTPRFFLNMARIEGRIAEFSRQYGLQVDPRARIWQLSVGEQQRVEILKMLYRGVEILIMDEPTAVLTPQEVEELFVTLRRMASEGKAVIFISHKLGEVMAISDLITVLRSGRVMATVEAGQTTKEELARMMVGREVLFHVEKTPVEPGEVVLEVRNLEALNDKGLLALKNVSFTIHQGEILGIAGVAGNGQRELAEVITGLRKTTEGRVFIAGCDLTNCSPRRVIREQVSHVPGDRLGMGLVPNLAVSDNVILKSYREPPLARGPFLDRSSIARFAARLIEAFSIVTPSQETPVKLLSGGNLQRTILAREISVAPRLMVAVHPTRGLDIGATESVRNLLLKQREEGAAILLISEDLDELLTVSDRVAVMYEGEIMGVVDAEDADIEEIGLMMAGTEVQSSKLKAQNPKFKDEV
ncbi:MAG: ABC transporter ATP-binding protein [Anaerolineae bacterium]|nr:ABC transporter ATP-binding protein [Anaerolineae bacterium]